MAKPVEKYSEFAASPIDLHTSNVTTCMCVDCGSDCPTQAVMKLDCSKHFICNVKCLASRVTLFGMKGDMLSCSVCLDQEEELSKEIYVFVNDSNIWIQAKKLASIMRKHKTVEDHRLRIDVGKLADVLADGRPVAKGVLYGSEPPPVDTVWKRIKERGWEVKKDKKNKWTGKEMKVNTQMVAEVTALAHETLPKKRTSIILVTGDAEVIPAIEQVMKIPKWQIEICIWKTSISRDLERFSEKEQERVKIKPLDEFLEKISFVEIQFDLSRRNSPFLAHRGGIVLTIGDEGFLDGGNFYKRIPSRFWLNKLESIAQWPFQYYWFDSYKQRLTSDLVLVFKSDSKAGDFDVAQFLADIQLEDNKQYCLPSVIDAQPFLKHIQALYQSSPNEKLKEFDIALQGVGLYNVDEVLNDEASDKVYESDASCDQADFKTVCYKPRNMPLRQKYSEVCPFQFNCKYGTKCQFKHSEEEKAYFKKRGGMGNPSRKILGCKHFASRQCYKLKQDCEYAHGESDAWCLNCRSSGHFTGNCPTQREVETKPGGTGAQRKSELNIFSDEDTDSSIEHTVMRKCTGKMTNIFCCGPLQVSEALLAANLISPEVHDTTIYNQTITPKERAARLVSVVTHRVEAKASEFGKFMSVLKDQGEWTQCLVEFMEQELKQLRK